MVQDAAKGTFGTAGFHGSSDRRTPIAENSACPLIRKPTMPASRGTAQSDNVRISVETFRLLRHLHRHNRKDWMDEHRERYQSSVVEPFRGLLEELTRACGS